MSKQGTAGKKKHVTLMITERLKIIRRLESGKSLFIMAIKYLTYLYQHRSLHALSDNPEYLIIHHVSSPMCARLKKFYCDNK